MLIVLIVLIYFIFNFKLKYLCAVSGWFVGRLLVRGLWVGGLRGFGYCYIVNLSVSCFRLMWIWIVRL